jgi:hypothetical protein
MEDKIINIRLNKEDYEIIKKTADVTNIGVSTFMREVSKNFAIKGGQNPEDVYTDGVRGEVTVYTKTQDVYTNEPNKVLEHNLGEYWEIWLNIIKGLNEFNFIENLCSKKEVGPRSSLKQINYILNKCRIGEFGESSETDTQVSQGKPKSRWSGWKYVCELPTDDGLVYRVEKTLPDGRVLTDGILIGQPGSELFENLSVGDIIE